VAHQTFPCQSIQKEHLMFKATRARFILLFLSLTFVIFAVASAAAKDQRGSSNPLRKSTHMSAGGQLAQRAQAALAAKGIIVRDPEASDTCGNEPDCEEDVNSDPDFNLSLATTQSETAIAVDRTGQHVVVGFNDFRGFAVNPTSVSGFQFSNDGGKTFIDGGQLPSPGNHPAGATLFPQVFGDPDIKYAGGCNFAYASIIVDLTNGPRGLAAVQAMGLHRSTDCGHTWEGPFTVPGSFNPNNQFTPGGAARDAADKEFIDIDPDTGRLIISWSNFTSARNAAGNLLAPGGVEISTQTTDDFFTAPIPTWGPRQVIGNTVADGQASIPRFFGRGSPNVVVAWEQFIDNGVFLGLGNAIGFARSTNNGDSFASTRISPEFFTMDQALGNDRSHNMPNMAVDNSGGRNNGNIYVVYADNSNFDGADIAFQRSTDGGLTFSAPVLLNARPGFDGPQWYPVVAADKNTGRVYVFYYDEGLRTSGDFAQVSFRFSDNGGRTFSAPQRLNNRPFHAGWGNDTGQPNLGDYNAAVAQGGELFAVFAGPTRPPAGFLDGSPNGSMTVPDVEFQRIRLDDNAAEHVIPLDLQAVNVVGGSATAGSSAQLQFVLRNYLSGRQEAGGGQATLSTTTPGVTVTQGRSEFHGTRPGETTTNNKPFVVSFAPSFAAGSAVELALDVKGESNTHLTLNHTLLTTANNEQTIFTEDFSTFPAGFQVCANGAGTPGTWCTSHAGGNNVVPWTTTTAFCGTSSAAAFHQNANDGLNGANTRFERLFSPPIAVPAGAQYVTVDFDVCYNTEDDPNFNIQAFDGFLLRFTEMNAALLPSANAVIRSVLAEAFEDELTTGDQQHYPKHLPRSGNANYFQDMSAWAGFSGGMQHVHMRMPGMAGTTFQLRFEFTQDGIGICTDVGRPGPCGVLFDNVVIKAGVNP
jgi:hypothetical protein